MIGKGRHSTRQANLHRGLAEMTERIVNKKLSREQRLHQLLCRVSAWLPEDHDIQAEILAELSAPSERAEPSEPPPGYRTGKRKLVYNKATKQIEVVDVASGFVVDSFDPPQEAM